MTDGELDFEQLAMEMDIRSALEFEAESLRRQVGTMRDGGTEVAELLEKNGMPDVAEFVRLACTDPLSLTVRDLTAMAMIDGCIPVISIQRCENPATNPEMAKLMRRFAEERETA
jgi:hypothetical protein